MEGAVSSNMLLFGVVAVFIASGLLFIRRGAVRDSRKIGVPNAQRTATFLGGMLSSKKNNAGSGTVRLEFFDWGIRLRGAGIFRPFAPVWEAQYQELAEARLVTAPKNQGVRFRAGGSAGSVIFWTGQGSEVLDSLEKHAVPVDRAADHVSDPPSPLISRSSGGSPN